MPAAILLPAGLVVIAAKLLLLTEADRVQPIGGDPQRHEILLDGAGAAVAEREVVLRRTALIAVTFNGDAHLRVIAQELSGLREGFASIAANVGFVKVKVSVAHFLQEEFVDIWSGLRLRRWRSRNRDARRGCGRAARTAGRDGVLGRVGRRNLC